MKDEDKQKLGAALVDCLLGSGKLPTVNNAQGTVVLRVKEFTFLMVDQNNYSFVPNPPQEAVRGEAQSQQHSTQQNRRPAGNRDRR